MPAIKPQSLQKGDVIYIVSPAGTVRPEFIDDTRTIIEQLGFTPRIATHAYGKVGTFSAAASYRRADFIEALTNKEVRAILCARGGFGAIHLLDGNLTSLINANPKWLIGFSDISALHAAWAKSGVMSIHGPMCRHISTGGITDNYTNILFQILQGGMPEYNVATHELNRIGNGKGSLIGGNMAVLTALCGTQFDIFTTHSSIILFIEDISEPLYKLERMLYQLILAGIFDRVKGLIVGQFVNCSDDAINRETIYQMIARITAPYNFPVAYNFPIGHVSDNYPLIESANAILEVSHEGVTLKYE